MSLVLKRASALSMAAYVLMLVFSASGSGAAAQEKVLTQAQMETTSTPIPVQPDAAATQAASDVVTPAAPPVSTLAELVAAEPALTDVSDELTCLAGAIYFESRNEPLAGQLAVGRVIVARSKSGRFPASYCGVVLQPSQFSFVRNRAMPPVKASSPTWRKAVAIARIAHDGRWKSPAEGALFFHATRVHPRWAKAVKVAKIENHIFYR